MDESEKDTLRRSLPKLRTHMNATKVIKNLYGKEESLDEQQRHRILVR